MFYDAELSFFRKILKNFHLQSALLRQASPCPAMDMGLRKLLGLAPLFQDTCFAQLKPNTIYKITDFSSCNYYALLLPDTQPPVILIVGPWVGTDVTKPFLYRLLEEHHIPPQLLPQIEKYYSSFPVFWDDSLLFAALNTLGEKLWGGMDSFAVQFCREDFYADIPPITESALTEHQENPLLSIQVLEARYATENELMQAVSQGLSHKAELIAGNLSLSAMEQRVADPIRNLKNYSIIMNTLLRKAAESGTVHPLHIDRLSSDYARKIEMINSREAGFRLQKEMIHKYCLLVKNHSMKGYHLLVRKIITNIDSDLTADLSLNAQAKLLNVNASYLSALFKKETGSTLTDYVNRKRIDHALLLLNSTAMQVQLIALHCGISDVNYFTKTFKKYIGKTPKEYRENILHYPSAH